MSARRLYFELKLSGAAVFAAGTRTSRAAGSQVMMTALHDDRLWLDRARRPEITLLLDLDGTMIPFADSPERAMLDDSGVELLRDLTRAGVHVVIVSGRPKPLIEQ